MSGPFYLVTVSRMRRLTAHHEIGRSTLESAGAIAPDAPEGAEDDLTLEEVSAAMTAWGKTWIPRPAVLLALDWAPEWADEYYIWPDGTIAQGDPLDVFREERRVVEMVRDDLDDAPLPIGDGTHAVVSAAYAHWGGLFHRAALHRADGTIPFQKVVLRRVVADTGEKAGVHEIGTAAELETVTAARMDRHNAAHNARHIVEAEYLPLVDALEAAYRAVPEEDSGVLDNPGMIAAVAAWRAYDVQGRMVQEMAPEKQKPTTERLETLRAVVLARLETEAAQRLTALTGQTQTWLSIQTATTYDASGLLRIVADARAEIEEATTAIAITEAATEATRLVKAWTFSLSVRVSSRVLSGASRRVRLVMMASGAAFVRVTLHRDAPGMGTATTPLADGSVSLPRDRFGSGVGTISAILTIGDSVPDDAKIFAEVVLSHTADGPAVVREMHGIGIVPSPNNR